MELKQKESIKKQRVRRSKWPKRQPEDGKARREIIDCQDGCGGFVDSSSAHCTAFGGHLKNQKCVCVDGVCVGGVL